MQTNEIKLYSLELSDKRTYLATLAFVVGNILLPQLCHAVPQGGITLLPIYFFTLIAAYKYGWRVGLMTAILSPLANHLLFGMPMAALLPVILIKSTILAFVAAYAADKTRNKAISIVTFAAIVASYQLLGTAAEWIIVGDFWIAIQDLRVGIPGILIQLFGGYLFVKHIKI